MFKKFGKFTFLIFGVLLLYPIISLADMSSSTYRIYADVISIGGGTFSSSTYSLNGTLGEPTIGIITSSTYEIKGGFQYVEISEDGDTATISLDMSSSTLNLGDLSTSTVSQATTTATITTDSGTGFTLTISEVDGVGLDAVGDGTVTAGSEEYGVAVTGTYAYFLDNDLSVENRTLAQSSGIVTADETDVTFKASISSTSTLGVTYTQTITFTASVNP